MKTASLKFIDSYNCENFGIPKEKVRDNTLVFFTLSGVDGKELKQILNLKCWTLSTWEGKYKYYFVYRWGCSNGGYPVVYCHAGFSPILIRFLKNKLKYQVSGIEQYDTKSINWIDRFPMKYSLWDHQKQAAEAWINAGKYGIIQSPTGSGKSLLAIYLIKHVKVRTIIVMHTKDLIMQWYQFIIDQLGYEIKDHIGIIGGLKEKEFRELKLDYGYEVNIKKDIVIATLQSLLNRRDLLGQERFGLLISDECLPYDSLVDTNIGKHKIGELYDNRENLPVNIRVKSLDLDSMKCMYSKFIPKKTVIKNMLNIKTETGIECQASGDHKFLTLDKDVVKYKELNSIKNIGVSLSKSYDKEELNIVARLFGYMLGDGHLREDYTAQFYGQHDDILKIVKDINSLKGHSLLDYKIYDRQQLNGEILTENGQFLNPCGDVSILSVYGHIFGYTMYKYGYPIGKKTNQVYDIPKWIMKGSKTVKTEFLAGFLGAEGQKTRNVMGTRSFEVMRFVYFKREDLIDLSNRFTNQLIELFESLGVKISSVNICDGNIRKDGTISKKVEFTMSNSKMSMLNFYNNIGYRYCHDKEIQGEIIRQYLLYSNMINKKVEHTYCYTTELRKKHYSSNNIVKKIKGINQSIHTFFDDKYVFREKEFVDVTKGMLDGYVKSFKERGKEAGTSRCIMLFQDWEKKVKGDIIFLDIISRTLDQNKQGYDLMVEDYHNYFINDINVHNCHRIPAEQFKKIANSVRAASRLGLSASLNRPDKKGPMMRGLIGDVIYKVNIRDLIKKGLIVEPKFYSIILNDTETQNLIEGCKLKKFEKTHYIKSISASSTIKFNYTTNLITELVKKGKKIIIYTDWVNPEENDSDECSRYVQQNYITRLESLGILVGGITKEMSSLERQRVFNKLADGQIQVIVFGQLGSEGIDIPKVDTVIHANAGASNVRFTQRNGRAMRRYPGKDCADIYEILLDTSKEKQWSKDNFYEYQSENFVKEYRRV